MLENWNGDEPIYRQLRNRVLSLLMEGTYKEGEAVPSVRQVASEYCINHLTVSKAYQELVERGLLEKRLGLGMFVIPGARKRLHDSERDKFLTHELPGFLKRMRLLGISREQVIKKMSKLGLSLD